jgi:hypothetical protein
MKRRIVFFLVITLLLSISWTENGYNRVEEGTADFAVLGWSRDGKIAYEETAYADAMPGTVRVFIVFDLVNDKTVFESSYVMADWQEEVQQQTEEEWFEQSKAEAKDFGIVYTEDLYTGGVPFYDEKNRAEYFPLVVKDGKILHNEDIDSVAMGGEGFAGSKIVMLKITDSDGSHKIEGKVICDHFHSVIMEAAHFLDIYKSPFEDRLAVLVETHSWGFEGSAVRGIFFMGCHMTYGFNSGEEYKNLYQEWLDETR